MVKKISRECVLCQKAYAKTVQQQIGQLPAHRVTPSPPFQTVGIDLAGPFLCHRGSPRCPTRIKTYVCIYVCFSTRAVHLELLTDMSAQAFLASFSRFCARRGCSSVIYSDNGMNFVGADRSSGKQHNLCYQTKLLIVFSANQNFMASSRNSLLVEPHILKAYGKLEFVQ